MESLEGVPLPTPLALLGQLAPTLTDDELVAVTDALVGPERLLWHVTLEGLRAEAAAASLLPGGRRLRRALARARELVESPQETKLRLLLVAAGFPEPDINPTIRCPWSGETFRLNLVYREQKVVLEYDGDWHRTDRQQWQRDRRKDMVLQQMGWTVIRVTSRDLTDPRALFAHLSRVLAGA
ncbi:DUF559 domain-containing protein [Brachybacterium sp. EF45031]|uniref:endonuclease domain-containing protein n=1 Tax=Brachybacterium sillae TaxID=2810536 RepID=UPI00217D97B2|nr:DUF559 domain-containing protein [Brachybacterium sillae]MCS6712060.1 DUF559 domain-containing protein [Brachybacterium sillae]